VRLFVSVDFPELADEIAEAQSLFEEASGLRLTDPGQAHVTLKFLGETDESRESAVREAVGTAVAESGVDPFEARLGGLGAFPSEDYISVVWIGVDDGGAMARLHEPIESHATVLGFEPADHEFTPHVTIARLDHAGGKDHVQSVLRTRDPTVGTTTVSEVRLTASTLTDDGPDYETVDRFPL
jgi:2'-5' RNA ligase